jgi:hypothetical protein
VANSLACCTRAVDQRDSASPESNRKRKEQESFCCLPQELNRVHPSLLGFLPKALVNHLRLSNDRFVTNSQMGIFKILPGLQLFNGAIITNEEGGRRTRRKRSRS